MNISRIKVIAVIVVALFACSTDSELEGYRQAVERYELQLKLVQEQVEAMAERVALMEGLIQEGAKPLAPIFDLGQPSLPNNTDDVMALLARDKAEMATKLTEALGDEASASLREALGDPPTPEPQAPASPPLPFTAAQFKAKKAFDVGDDKVAVTSQAWSAAKWIFDRNEDTYFQRAASKGNAFTLVDFNVTSKSKDPVLPRFAVFSLRDGTPVFRKHLETKFFRWSDYSTYLGTYADYRNSFTHSDSVKFTAGVELDKDIADGPLLLVLDTKPCLNRISERFESPAVKYKNVCPFETFEALAKDPERFLARFQVVAVRKLKEGGVK